MVEPCFGLLIFSELVFIAAVTFEIAVSGMRETIEVEATQRQESGMSYDEQKAAYLAELQQAPRLFRKNLTSVPKIVMKYCVIPALQRIYPSANRVDMYELKGSFRVLSLLEKLTPLTVREEWFGDLHERIALWSKQGFSRTKIWVCIVSKFMLPLFWTIPLMLMYKLGRFVQGNGRSSS